MKAKKIILTILAVALVIGLGSLLTSHGGKPHKRVSHALSAAQASATYHPVVNCEARMLARVHGEPTMRQAEHLAKRVCAGLPSGQQYRAAKFVHWWQKPASTTKSG